MSKTTPEGKVKAQIRQWLLARGAYYAMPIGSGFGNAGVPDFLCCIKGHFLAIEAKAPGRRSTVTALQKRNLQQIQDAGGSALLVDDVAQLDEWEASMS